MWGYNIPVVIVPSFLAFAFLGLSIYPHSLTNFNLWFVAIWIASGALPMIVLQGQLYGYDWTLIDILIVIGITLSMARECSGDRVDRVQDLQGVPGS